MTSDKRVTRHTLRTLVQVIVALAAAIPTTAAAFGISGELAAKVSALMGLLVVAVTAAHNGAESAGLPVLLPNPNAPAEPGADGEAGWGIVELLAIVAVVFIVLLVLGYLH